jgi:hypothetical protein
MMLSFALIGAGALVLHEPAEPHGTIGPILIYSGVLLLIMVFLLGIADFSRYLFWLFRPIGLKMREFKLRPRATNLWPPRPDTWQPRTQEPPRPQSRSENRPLAAQTVKILVVGYSGAGKTLMLASLYHCFAHGTPAGIRFTTDDESNRTLVDYATSIRDPRRPLPAGTQETKRWTFAVRVESGAEESDAFTIEYLDYAGGFIERMLNSPDPSLVEELDLELKRELESTNVLMGVLDGAKLVKLMTGDYDVDIVGEIDRLLNIMVRTGHRNIHLVITKWDLMRWGGDGGAYYTISEVRQKLDQVSKAFHDFRLSPKMGGNMRIIPVSALGVNRFVHYDPTAESSATRQPEVPWLPWNVHVPFFSAVPDILASDVPWLATGRAESLSKIGLTVFDIAGLIEVRVPLGVVELKVPVGEILQRVMAFARSMNQRGMAPASLTVKSALSHVLSESYAVLHEFEAGTPDSRVQPPGPYG